MSSVGVGKRVIGLLVSAEQKRSVLGKKVRSQLREVDLRCVEKGSKPVTKWIRVVRGA